jgi:hypothetical protein
MLTNAHKVSLLILFLLCASTYAASGEESRPIWMFDNTAWAESKLGECFPSVKVYLKEVWKMLPEEIDEIWHKNLKNNKGKYLLITDPTPSRNPLSVIFEKNQQNKVCIILYAPAADLIIYNAFFYNINNGILPDEIITSTNELPNIPYTKITYRFNASKKYYEPLTCILGKSKYENQTICKNEIVIPCYKAFGDGGYIPPLQGAITNVPSYDCTKSTITDAEKRICISTKLSILDAYLAFIYENIKNIPANKDNEKLSAEQRTWFKNRNNCDTNNCFDSAYLQRIGELCNKYPDIPAITPVCAHAFKLDE